MKEVEYPEEYISPEERENCKSIVPRTYKVTSGGRVTIPKEVQERIGVKPGDFIEFFSTNLGPGVRKAENRIILSTDE